MNWLEEFANWVEAKVDDPDAVLALSWITEWENGAGHVAEPKRHKKVSESLADDDVAVRRRRFLAWFGDLRQFQHWLKAKADDPKARLVLAWTAEFEHKQVQRYLEESIQTFLGDPPDNEFLDGFLSALLLVAEEAAGLPMDTHPYAEARNLRYASAN